MPSVWKETIEEHRRAVREATMDTAVALVAEHGLRAVTMSQIAKKTGIGRATLYKYFADVESILHEWHEHKIKEHLSQLANARNRVADNPRERLEAVLETYALIFHESRQHHDTELAALMHREGHVARAEEQLRSMIRDLIADAQKNGEVQNEVPPAELASYCLNALSGAASLASKAAVKRLVAITMAGLRSSG